MYIHPDPLECVYRFSSPSDREIVGLIASSLAFGGVKQILGSVDNVLQRLDNQPSSIVERSERDIVRLCRGFKHRYATCQDLAQLLRGAQCVLEIYPSLNACFLEGYRHEHDSTLPALTQFVRSLRRPDSRPRNFLLPLPEDGSACKRLHMYLRWMVRRDAVDPGTWEGVCARHLLAPLDTHMFRIAELLGFTTRAHACLKAVREITAAFARIAPEDPVRYDFALTRLGIRSDTTGYDSLAAYRALPLDQTSVRAKSAE